MVHDARCRSGLFEGQGIYFYNEPWSRESYPRTAADGDGRGARRAPLRRGLGASSYTYAEARWSETLPDWIGAHVNAFDFLGGLPRAAVPDNLKAGITKPSRYEPGVNRTYQDLADHYGFVVLPARIRRPRDKAKVEAAIGIVSRFVLQAAQSALLLP